MSANHSSDTGMIVHLPECGRYCDGKPPKCRGGDCTLCDEVECICPVLRACEERVREEERGGAPVAAIELAGYSRGYAAALDAAREAVADAVVCENGCHSDALAAIDALREETK